MNDPKSSWARAVTRASRAVVEAYETRADVFQAAYDAGLSFREIAAAASMTPGAVHRIIGRQTGGPVVTRFEIRRCDVCGQYSMPLPARELEKRGWIVIDNKDVCASCAWDLETAARRGGST